MLASCSVYLDETRLRAGTPVDHDDSVNERHEGSKLNVSWSNTKDLWRQVFGENDEAAQGTEPWTANSGLHCPPLEEVSLSSGSL